MVESEIPEGTVTVLFTDLVESTKLNQSLGDDRARELGRQVETMARRVVDENRGVLIKEMGDGLMAAFASARRAVAASRAIQVEMSQLHRGGLDDSVEMRIGLHTGEVLSEDGDIHGETVIIAKRIEGLAPAGGILASETVYGVLGTARDELVEQGATELKGIDAEWRLFLVPVPDEEADSAVMADTEPTPYVGRMAEREQLRTMLDAAAAGRGAMVLIGGPAGLGKSRLTQEAAAMADRLGMSVLVGNCLDMESPPPYQPSIDHLEQAARNASSEQFRRALGENAPEVAKLLPSLRQRYDDIPASPDLTPEQERRYMLHGVGEFIERAAQAQPLMLVFEDLHWADESTLLFLRHLGGRLADVPVLIVGTYRDDELEPGRPLTTAIGPLHRDVGAVDLRPRLLTVEEVEAVLAARSGQPAPSELVDLVFNETQGNPFFVEELFRHLRDSGKLFDDDGAWRSGFEIGETEVPQGVRLVIARRLEQLDDEHRRVLATAAVVGRTFAFGILEAASAAGEDTLFDALEAAERAHVIEETPTGRDARYQFIHEQIRQTLVGELSLARRQRIHLRVADALDAAGDRSTIEIAHHVLNAGPVAPAERTVSALMAAAAANLESLAFEEALRHLDNAMPLVSDVEQVTACLMQVRALRGAGHVDEALTVLDNALAGASPAEQVTLRLKRVQLLNDQYRAGEGLDDIAALMAAADSGDDPALAIEVQLASGRAHYILSLDRPDHAHDSRAAYEAAYEAAKAQGDAAKMARALIPTSWFTDYWTDYQATANANLEEAVELAQRVGDEDLLLDALTASLRRVGAKRDVITAEDLMKRLEARRDPVKLNAHCFWMMWEYLRAGRFSDSVAMCDRGIALADLIGTQPVQYGSIKAIALTEMGRFDLVADAIEQEVTDDNHPFGQAVASLAQSVYLSRIAAWPLAAASLNDTIERAVAVMRVWMQHWAASLAGTVAAHARVETDGLVVELTALETVLGGEMRGAAAAEVALVEGRPGDALDALGQFHLDDDPAPSRQVVAALDLAAQAALAVGDAASALRYASTGLAMAMEMEFGSVGWRLRTVKAAALDDLGQGDVAARERSIAGAEFQTLAARIVEPELRRWFERQPLAPGGSGS